MEKIKYRAYDKFNDEWTYSEIMGLAEFFKDYEMRLEGDNNVSLEEYTGHKNWCENDIIRSNHFVSESKTHYIEHQIIWSDNYCGWFMKNVTTKDIEAAGNIQMFVYLRSAAKPVLIGTIHEVKS